MAKGRAGHDIVEQGQGRLQRGGKPWHGVVDGADQGGFLVLGDGGQEVLVEPPETRLDLMKMIQRVHHRVCRRVQPGKAAQCIVAAHAQDKVGACVGQSLQLGMDVPGCVAVDGEQAVTAARHQHLT